MATIVALRVLIGWHFLYEGLVEAAGARVVGRRLPAAGARAARGPLQGDRRRPEPARCVNPLTMWGLVAIGLGLVLGCFTRLASAAGMLLLLMFYLCNPPFVGYFYSIPTEGSYLVVNKNLVELAGLAVVFVTGSGRVAGLDRIIHGWRRGKAPRAS